MSRFPISMTFVVIVLLASTVQSVKIGYHSKDIAEISDLIEVPDGFGPPDNGSYTFDSQLALPFSDHDGGKGAIGIVPMGQRAVTKLIQGFDGASIPRDLFWETDTNGDAKSDLIFTDVQGRVYVITNGILVDDIQLSPDEAVLTDVNGTLKVSDVSGDGRADLLVLEEDGSKLRVVLGPLDGPSGSFEIDLPLECRLLDTDLDITGDGLPEIVVVGGNGKNDTMLAYDGASLSLISDLPLPGDASSIDHGDIDGDGLDDLVLLFPGPASNGSISVVFGKGAKGTILDGDMVWSIIADPIGMVHRDLVLSILDLDGDRAEDVIIGDPTWDSRGRVSIFYGGSEIDLSTDRLYSYPDADLRGTGTGSHLSPTIISSLDHDGDMLPDIFLKNDTSLARWSLPANSPPDEMMVLRFVEPGSDRTKERAQVGETVGIRLVATGGGVSFPDVAKVVVLSRGDLSSSWTLLKETGADSSIYTGTLQLLDGTMPGRSKSVDQGDVLDIYYKGSIGTSIEVRGWIGQDDPPYIEGLVGNLTTLEGRPYSLEVKAFDPENDPMTWSVSGAPHWLGLDEGILTGTPMDGDVGSFDLTINVSANGKNATKELTITVLNIPPSLEPVSVPLTIEEGELYTGSFQFNGALGPLKSIGPANQQWLGLLPNGSLSGVPRNKDVGMWDFNVTATDLHGSNTSHVWSVEVSNAPPVLQVPSVSSILEGSVLNLDLNESDEGDGLTMYFLQGAPDGMVVNRTSGIISYTVPIGSGDLTFKAGVSDGHGGSDREDMVLTVVSSEPVLLTDLPDVMTAGEVLTMDLRSNLEGMEGFRYHFGMELPFIFPSDSFGSSGYFHIAPWNLDAGPHSLNITYGVQGPGERTYEWSFTVLTNGTFTDPTATLDVLGQRGTDLDLMISFEGDSTILFSIALLVQDPRVPDIPLRTIPLSTDQIGAYVLDVSNLTGTVRIRLLMTVIIRVESQVDGEGNWTVGRRAIETSVTVELRSEDDGQDGVSTTLLLITGAIILILLIVLLVALLSVERTSYRLQTVFASGTSRNDEVILSSVQRHPGIRFRELQEGMDMTRRELVSGLLSLTSSGHIRAVPDRSMMRFLPTVGSFVKGPLALDRNQGMLLDLLKGGAELTVGELSEKSGLSASRVNKELSLLTLKDAISSKGKGSEKRFYLDRRQRARLASWARSGR